MIDRDSACLCTAIAQLIRRVAYNDIEFHIGEYGFGILGVDKFVGVALQCVVAVVYLPARPALAASAVLPGVFRRPEADISIRIVKGRANRIGPVRLFAAIDRTARQEGRQFGNGYAEQLLGENVVGPLLSIGNPLAQPLHQPFGNLAQEDSRFAYGVKESRIGIAPQLRRQQIEHAIDNDRRGEHFVVA